jgi:hypothetical protein
MKHTLPLMVLCLGLLQPCAVAAQMSPQAKDEEFTGELCVQACSIQAEYALRIQLRGDDVVSSFGRYPRCWGCELHRKDGTHYKLGRPGRRVP